MTADDLTDVQLMALCIKDEAGTESHVGKLAVAHVVINRVGKRTWYGHTIRDVILLPWQFSAFNEPNFRVIPISDPCYVVSELALGGATVDVTRGATHYHADYVTPNWLPDMRFLVRYGRHLFYKARHE